jgi:hypothetical protein
MFVTSWKPLLRRLSAIMNGWERLITLAGNPYRPELHYMRGPGPKWHAKQDRGTGSAL